MIITALDRQYGRLAARGEVPAVGFSTARISACVILDPLGRAIDVQDMRRTAGKKKVPAEQWVPEARSRTRALVPFFLWDKTGYALGFDVDAKPKSAEIVLKEDQAESFLAFHEEMLAEAVDPDLQALLSFLRGRDPDTLRSDFPILDELAGGNVVFRIDGKESFVHDSVEGRHLWLAYREKAQGQAGQCLASGEEAPLATLHPLLKNIDGAQSSGAGIVTFNENAFESYGKKQGANAPVSESVAFAYTTALNHMLRRSEHNRQRLSIGDATVVFWAESEDDGAAKKSEDFWSLVMNPPVDDASEARRMEGALRQLAVGRAVPDMGLDPRTRLYVLGLAPNASRLSLRLWEMGRLETLSARVAQHFDDLSLEPSPFKSPPSVRRLVWELSAQGKAESIPPLIAGETLRAVLYGTRYPRSLLTALLMRMRADSGGSGGKKGQPMIHRGVAAAICKAVINRDIRLSGAINRREIPMALDKENTEPGYRLGRLFAVLEHAQRVALGPKVESGVAERFYGSASATPASVFPLLLRNYRHHASGVRKKHGENGERRAVWLERQVGEITDGLPAALPAHLNIEQQGRFAVGYYQQRQQLWRSSKSASTAEDAPDGSAATSDSELNAPEEI